MLRELGLKQAYHKPEDDIAKEFYLPCMDVATHYDRAVGYFSSSIYALAWPSLKGFVRRDGKIRLICSPILLDADSAALYEGYSTRALGEQGEAIRIEFRRLLDSESTVKSARVLAALVALGVVEFRIAWITSRVGGRSHRLFHDKLGIFTDEAGDSVAFKGSMNETWAGLALDGNLESVDVFSSWQGERENNRVQEERSYFERLWNAEFPGVDIRPIPDVARDELVSAADTAHWEELADEICIEITSGQQWAPVNRLDARKPRPHQVAALNAWEERGRRGIFEHATGSGKTFTALCAIDKALENSEIPMIVVPSDLLLRQWTDELNATFSASGIQLLICGGGHTEWRSKRYLRYWTRSSSDAGHKVVLTTIQTASSEEFLSLCVSGTHIFLVADEVHRLGADGARQILEIDTGPRLGLSATPERFGDPDGTAAIFDYFKGVVPPPFSIQDAIAAGTLTPYAYHIHCVYLNDEEQEQWSEITAKIRVLYARSKEASEKDPRKLQHRLKRELIRRARIVKSAHAKVGTAVDILKKHYIEGSRWIVYCDDQDQLNKVLAAVRNEIQGSVYEYHSAMTGDREKTLGLFEDVGGIVVSIRCLDEGVDIPSVDSALILASSKNPREYVQRRGRVLRRSKGKSVANIHDALVVPRAKLDEPPETAIIEGEIARAIEFGKTALNPSCIADLEKLAIEFEIDLRATRTAGVEDDEIEGESL